MTEHSAVIFPDQTPGLVDTMSTADDKVAGFTRTGAGLSTTVVMALGVAHEFPVTCPFRFLVIPHPGFSSEKALGCGALTYRQVAPGDQQGLS